MTEQQLISLTKNKDFIKNIQDPYTHISDHMNQKPYDILRQLYHGKKSHSSFDARLNVNALLIRTIQNNATDITSWLNSPQMSDTLRIRTTYQNRRIGNGAMKTNQNLIRAKNTDSLVLVLKKYAGDPYGFHAKTMYSNIIHPRATPDPQLQSQLHAEVPNMPEFATVCPEEKAYLLYQTDPSSHNLAVYSDNDPDFNGKPSLSLYYPLGSDLYRMKLSGTNAVWEKHPINDPRAPYQPASPSLLQTRYPDYAATQAKLEALIQTHTPKPRRLPDPIEQSSDEEEDEMQI